MFRRLLFMTAVLVATRAGLADDNPSAHKTVRATVTDREGTPLERAEVYKLNWFEDAQSKPLRAYTDAQGVFEFAIDTGSAEHSNYVIVHREGYGFGALNLETLPARVRLFQRRSIALRILDEQGRPVNHARVSPGEVDFSEEFLQARVPRELALKTAAVTRGDGWAILRSTRPSSLRSLVVEAEGYGAQEFPSDFSDETKFRVMQLSNTAAVECRLMKGAEPAAGWKILGTVGELEPFRPDRRETVDPMKPITPAGIACFMISDSKGKVYLDHAIVGRELELILIDNANDYRGQATINVEQNTKAALTIQVPRTMQEIGEKRTARVVDVQTREPVAGMHLRFACNDWPHANYEVTSDSLGNLDLMLLPGQWYVHVKTPAQGYCKALISKVPVVVKQGDTQVANFEVAKAKQLSGTLRNIDLELHRARWIRVYWTDEAKNSGEVYGTIHPDSTFDVSVPVYATAESFSIVSRPGHNGQLLIESLDPLVLSSID